MKKSGECMLTLIIAAALFSTNAFSQEVQTLRVGVMPIRAGMGIEPAIVNVVGDNLIFELRKYKNVKVISIEDVEKMINLEQKKQMMGCEDDTSCIVEIAGALGVDKLVITSMGRAGSLYAVSVKLADMETGEITEQAYEKFHSTTGEELLGIMKKIVKKVLPYHQCEPEALDAEPGVSAGVEDEKGFPVWTTALGVAALMGVGVGVYGSIKLSGANSDYDGLAKKDMVSRGEADDVESKGDSGALIANIGYGVAGAATVSALLVYFLVESGHSSEAEDEPAPEDDEEAPSLSIAPVINPNILGLTLQYGF